MPDTRGILRSSILIVLNQITGERGFVAGRPWGSSAPSSQQHLSEWFGVYTAMKRGVFSLVKGHSVSFPDIQEAFSPSKLFAVTAEKER